MHLVVPIKRYADAKQRLAALVTPDRRRAVARAMAESLLLELATLSGLNEIVVATSEPELRSIAKRHGFGVLIDDPHRPGLNHAVTTAVDILSRGGATDIGVVFSDLPLFTADEFSKVLAHHRQGQPRQMTMVTDRLGDGTNIRLCRPGNSVPAGYGKASASRHRAWAEAAEVHVSVFPSKSLSLDLDHPEDIPCLFEVAEAVRPLASNTVLPLLASWHLAIPFVGAHRCL